MSTFPSDEFLWEILEKWASRFHCPITTLQQPGATLLPVKKYAGEKVIVLSQIAKHTFVEHDPEYSATLRRVTAGLRATGLSAADLVRSWGAGAFIGQDAALIHYLYPPDLSHYSVPAPFAVRQLSPADAAAMKALKDACTPEDVDDGFVELTHELVFGCFSGDQLVAASSGYRLAGFMNIGALTHPAFRSQGLGKAVVAAVCAWCADHGVIAECRCSTTNEDALALARALNFRLFFQSESLWLA